MRLRERYLCEGPGGLGDAELLALLVETGLPGRSALTIAVDWLERVGGLRGLATGEARGGVDVPGVGLARAVRVHAAVELGRRIQSQRPAAGPIRTAEDAFRAVGPALSGLAEEELHALYLDRRHRPLAHRRLTRGSDHHTIVDARQVFRVAVGLGASAVILAHNHPSGDPTPSAMDHEVTRRVGRAGDVLGIPLLDHLVVGCGTYVALGGGIPGAVLPTVG